MTVVDTFPLVRSPDYSTAYDTYYRVARHNLADPGSRYSLELATQPYRMSSITGSASTNEEDSFHSLVMTVHDLDPVAAARTYAQVFIEHPDLNIDALVSGGWRGKLLRLVPKPITTLVRKITGKTPTKNARRTVTESGQPTQGTPRSTTPPPSRPSAPSVGRTAPSAERTAPRTVKPATPPVGQAARPTPTVTPVTGKPTVNSMYQTYFGDDIARNITRKFGGPTGAGGAGRTAGNAAGGAAGNAAGGAAGGAGRTAGNAAGNAAGRAAGHADDGFPNADEALGYQQQINNRPGLKANLLTIGLGLSSVAVPMGMYFTDMTGREAGIQVESDRKRLEEQAAVIEQTYLDWGLPPAIAAEYAQRYVDNGGVEDGAINMGCFGPLAQYFSGCDQGTSSGGSGSSGGSVPIDDGSGGYPIDDGQTTSEETLFDQGYKVGDFVQDSDGNIFVVDASGLPVPISSDQLQDLIGGNSGGTQTPGTGTGTQIGTTQTISPIYIPSTYGYGPSTGTGTSGGSAFGQNIYNSQLNSYYDLFGGGSSTGTSSSQYYY